ncbi:MAG: hypothetical protein HUJ65_07515 [Oscillospiraceae bacterium]|nr:hypothetical protein [Oscillospiraceae bacterium]
MSDKLEKACPCKAAEELSLDELDKVAGGVEDSSVKLINKIIGLTGSAGNRGEETNSLARGG